MLSSYLSGTASIKLPAVQPPPRTTSLKFRDILTESPPASSLLSMFEDEFEDIDLEATSDSSCSSSEQSVSTTNSVELTLESMQDVIAAAIKLSASDSSCLSSLSAGNASIKYNKKPAIKKENRFSKRLFRWSHAAPAPAKQMSSIQKPLQVYDDGKEELIYRGIRVKEIRSTLEPMILPMNFDSAFPEISIQRPEFARINY